MLRAIHGRNQFYTRKLHEAGLDVGSAALSRGLQQAAADDEGGAERRSGGKSALGHGAHRAARQLHALLPDLLVDRPAAALDRHQRELAVAARVLEEPCIAGRGVRPGDRVFFPFSFGPFLGFWAGFEAGPQIGLHCVPGGGMSSQIRLSMIETIGATVVCCTPTYALRLAEIAEHERRRPLSEGTVRMLIVAGEPGGSIPATRERIERSWGARVIDHHGLTEVGPVSFECWEAPGSLHINEAEFIAEVLDPQTGHEVSDGQTGELVLTNLGRTASPVIRYRTGDIVVRRSEPCRCGRTWARLEGGILGRADDMVNIRGVNVYPVGIESVVRRLPEVVEFRSVVSRQGSMRSLRLEIEVAPEFEDSNAVASRVAYHLREALGLSVNVHVVESGTLPRFEMKANRFVVEA